MKQFHLFIWISLCAWGSCLHATLIEFDFEGESTAPSFLTDGVQSSSFLLNQGSTSFPAGNESSESISANGWNGEPGAKYWQFSLSPQNASDRLSISQLTFDDRASGTGPQSWSLSINGITVIQDQSTHAAFGSTPMNAIDLGDLALEMLSNVDIQILGYEASSASGTWRLDNVAIQGTLTAVPEPQNFAIIAGMSLLGFIMVRRYSNSKATPLPGMDPPL